MENIEKHLGLLGLRVKDRVTGFKGVVTSISFDLFGCIQAIVTCESKDGESKQLWFDVTRLKVMKKVPVMKQPNFKIGLVAEGRKGGFRKPILTRRHWVSNRIGV